MCLVAIILDSAATDTLNRPPGDILNPSGSSLAPSLGVYIITLGTCVHMVCNFLEKAMAPHSSTLAWEIPWMEEPGGLQSMGSLRVGHD